MIAALHVAANDVVRFLRRRDTSWLIAIATCCQLVAAGLVSSTLEDEGAVSWILDDAAACALAVEWVALGVVAYYVTFFGERHELEGARVLLRLVPAPTSHLLLGKLLGAAGSCLVLHAALVLPWIVVPGAVGSLAILLWPWLYAITLFPEAMLLARVHAEGRWRYLAVRILTVVRLGMPLVLMALAVRAGPSGRPLGEIAAAVPLSIIGLDPRPLASFFPAPLGPLPILFGWQLLSGIPLVLLLLRRR